MLNVLSHKQLNELSKYRHRAEKTTLEKWMIAHPSGWLEKRLFPESWTPNCITLIGQVPQLLMILVVFCRVGMSLTRKETIDSGLFFWMAASV